MTGLFYRLMFRVGCSRVCSFWNKVMAKILNALFPAWCKVFPKSKGVNKEMRDREVIVSLTSFPVRFEKLHLCIESILRQTYKPDKVILWLIEDECKDAEIPESLVKLKEYGLVIRYAKENLKPHNKFIFSAMEFKNSIIITIDDDIIYPSYIIEQLMMGYKKHSNCIVCNMAHQMTFDAKGKPNPYSKWKGGAINEMGPSFDLTALGVGSVLYPPHIFDATYFDIDLIKKLSLTGDDLWLKYNEVRLSLKVYKVNAHAKNPVTISKTQGVALTNLNNGSGRNDAIIEKLNSYFDIDWKKLLEE